MAFEPKQSVEMELPCILIDDTDFKSPETGVAFGSVTVKYGKAGASAQTTKTLNTGNWIEVGTGDYRIKFSTSESDTLGLFTYTVTGSGFLPYYGAAVIKVNDIDDVATKLDNATLGASINIAANDQSTLTTGTTASGDYTETVEQDDIYWQMQDDAGTDSKDI